MKSMIGVTLAAAQVLSVLGATIDNACVVQTWSADGNWEVNVPNCGENDDGSYVFGCVNTTTVQYEVYASSDCSGTASTVMVLGFDGYTAITNNTNTTCVCDSTANAVMGDLIEAQRTETDSCVLSSYDGSYFKLYDSTCHAEEWDSDMQYVMRWCNESHVSTMTYNDDACSDANFTFAQNFTAFGNGASVNCTCPTMAPTPAPTPTPYRIDDTCAIAAMEDASLYVYTPSCFSMDDVWATIGCENTTHLVLNAYADDACATDIAMQQVMSFAGFENMTGQSNVTCECSADTIAANEETLMNELYEYFDDMDVECLLTASSDSQFAALATGQCTADSGNYSSLNCFDNGTVVYREYATSACATSEFEWVLDLAQFANVSDMDYANCTCDGWHPSAANTHAFSFFAVVLASVATSVVFL